MAKDEKSGTKTASSTTPYRAALRAAPGTDLSAIDTRGTPDFDGDKGDGKDELAALAEPVSDLQWPEADFDVEEQRKRLTRS